MSADKYELRLSGFGNLYIVKPSKANPDIATGDKKMISKSEFLPILVAWLRQEMANNQSDEYFISENGSTIFEIRYIREKGNSVVNELAA